MRTKKSKINILVSLLGQFLGFALSLVTRSMLASQMPMEYLGVNGLFTNILSILSLAELGIGSAMLYVFYAPVAENDILHIQKLMNLYRRLYRIVACAVGLLGLSLIPFLGFFVKSDVVIEHMTLIYLMYLAQSVATYSCVYKTAILTANQNQYIYSLYQYFFMFLRYALQIVVLVVTKNFYLYLTVQILCNVLPNVAASIHAENMYPYIKENRKVLPDKQEQLAIFANIRAMFLHKIGDICVNSVDNLLMSSMIGLGTVGIYSNYKLISTNIASVLAHMFSSTMASVGNLVALERDNSEKIHKVFRSLHLGVFFFYSYCSVAMAILFRPFILLVFGPRYVFPTSTALLIVALFYLNGMRTMVLQFRTTLGLFKHDRYKAICEAVFNLVLSFVLAKKWGINGILFATVADLLLLPYIVEPYILFRYGFSFDTRRALAGFYLDLLLKTMLMIGCGLAAYKACTLIQIPGYAGFVVKGMTVTAVYGILMLIVYIRNDSFRTLVSYVVKRK